MWLHPLMASAQTLAPNEQDGIWDIWASFLESGRCVVHLYIYSLWSRPCRSFSVVLDVSVTLMLDGM